MGKRVLILMGSPRKNGNCDRLCGEFAKGAESAGHIIKKINVQDKNIKYCTACESCARNGGKCIHNDDMAEILEDMINSDVILLASPVYFYSISGQLKTLIDRCVAKYTQITAKDFYFIACAAEDEAYTLDRTIECFRGFTDCLPSSKEKGVIKAGGVWKKGDVDNTAYMKQAFDMGRAV